MRLISVVALGFIAGLTLPLLSTAGDSHDPRQHLQIQETAKMHGVHSRELSEDMRRIISTLIKGPKDGGDPAMKARYYQKLAKAAIQVTQTALSIERYLPGDELSEEEAAKFRDLAVQLYTEVRHIERGASGDNAGALDAALDRFNQTCIDRHRLFREM